MSNLKIYPLSSPKKLDFTLPIPGDKSISHRALLLGALAEGTQEVQGFLPAGDCLATLNVLTQLGIKIDHQADDHVFVHGKGLYGFETPQAPLNCQRSGTTMRLIAGILAGQGLAVTLTGDPQLLKRPMRRIITPLQQMGAHINARHGKAPLKISPSSINAIDYPLPIASAQVKSAVLLAGLYADKTTTIEEPAPARDHTEILLRAMGAPLETQGNRIAIHPTKKIIPQMIHVPADFSSAAFFLVLASCHPTLKCTFEHIGLNPTRTGLFDCLVEMNANIIIQDQTSEQGEKIGTMIAQSATLEGLQVAGHRIVRMIDEFPIFAVAATQAYGTTVVHQAEELRHKESDRITAIVTQLNKMGAQIVEQQDGFTVKGRTPLQGTHLNSYGDHRLAMALVIASLLASSASIIESIDCIHDSFPTFFHILDLLGAHYEFIN